MGDHLNLPAMLLRELAIFIGRDNGNLPVGGSLDRSSSCLGSVATLSYFDRIALAESHALLFLRPTGVSVWHLSLVCQSRCLSGITDF